MGGESVLSTVERGLIDRRFPEKFVAAIAYYPWCWGHSAVVNAPTLILIGAEDNRTPAAFCREMVASPHEGGAAIDLILSRRPSRLQLSRSDRSALPGLLARI